MLKKILLYSLLFYTLFGFIAVPLILKPQIINGVKENANAQLEIDTLYFNPFLFRLEIQGLELYSLDKIQLINTKKIILDLEFYSLLGFTIYIKELIIEEPDLFLVLNKDKTINFNALAKKNTKEVKKKNTKSQIPRIIVDKISLINGSLNYEDYSQQSKFSFRVDTLGFELKDIDTKNMKTSDAHLRMYMKLEDGGFFDLKSKILGLEPFIVQGSLDYEASKLYSQWRYIKDSLNLEVANGKLSLHTQYNFNSSNLEATRLWNLNLSLDGLRLKPKGNYTDVLGLKSFFIKNATIKPFSQDIHIQKIALESLDIKVLRDENKTIDWQEYIKFNTKPQSNILEQKDAVKQEPWSILVDTLSLEKIKVDFEDKGVKPNVNNSLNELNLYAQNITLDGTRPLAYQMDFLVNDSFKCKSFGSIIHKVLDAKTSTLCSGLDVERFVPYIDEVAKKELKIYDIKLRSLQANFDADVNVVDVNSSLIVDVQNANILLSDFALNKKSNNKRLMTFSDLNISGISLNTNTKEVSINDTNIKNLHIRIKSLKDGSMNIDNLLVPRKSGVLKSKKKQVYKKEKEYKVRLNSLTLKDAKLSFQDQKMRPIIYAQVDKINLNIKNIDSKKYSWMSYQLSSRVNSSANMKSRGSIRHTPLKQKGKLSLERLALKDFTPYLQKNAFVSLDDGYMSFKTKTQYAVSKSKADLIVDGSFKLEEIFLSDSRDKSSLLSFNEVNLKEFTLETSPNRLFVNEVDVDAFYVNANIDANKSMNFAGLAKNIDKNTTKELEKSTNADTREAFPMRIMKVNVKNGSATFSDSSLAIDFKTNIHNLNGVIYAISTNPHETSYIDLAGDIDKYGSTKLKGSVNSSNPKLFTDLDFNFRNLDLSAMSGYSRTFAGYHIDDGKLFLNFNYDIQDSQLQGENSIIIKKIKLGEEVDIKGGSLPLGFVVALLEDGDGIIDIEMPVRGNVDEPDFKYGALVWKTFGNLILKAVASPFTFLGSLLGIGGDELKYAEFEAGSSIILASEREKLDNIAKLLVKRPKIILSIGGAYDLSLDKKALQKEKLIALVVKKSGAKNEEERVNAMTIDLLENIYEDAKDDNKIEVLQERLEKQYEGDAFDRKYLKALVKLCIEFQIISEKEMQELAKKRSRVLKSYLINDKGIETTRVNELDVIIVTSDENQLIRSKLDVNVQ